MEMKAFILHLKQHFIIYLLLKMGGEVAGGGKEACNFRFVIFHHKP